MPPQIRWLPDGKRLHLNDGPIDLLVEPFGDQDEVQSAYRAAATRFVTVLDELCQELTLLRKPMLLDSVLPTGVVARRMTHAVAPYAQRCYITPMAAVAGAVAEEILSAMTSVASLARAYVNNGGDIAFHLASSEQFVAGMIERPDRPSLLGTVTLRSDQPSRGIATSGHKPVANRIKESRLAQPNHGPKHRNIAAANACQMGNSCGVGVPVALKPTMTVPIRGREPSIGNSPTSPCTWRISCRSGKR